MDGISLPKEVDPGVDDRMVGGEQVADMNFARASFDCVSCGDLLAYVRKPGSLLQKSRSWLTTNGQLLALFANVQHHDSSGGNRSLRVGGGGNGVSSYCYLKTELTPFFSGLFRENVLAFEKQCRISGVMDPQFLIASHIKPWRVARNEERLDGENGLLLSPNSDLLLDRGFISFDDDGALLISPIADQECLHRMGIPIDIAVNVGEFSPKQREYLAFHRRNVFLEAGKED
jgi:hypothetical protein